MEESARNAVAYIGQFETWAWWEKALWIGLFFAFLRLMWWLFECATDETRAGRARMWAGLGLLAGVIALMGAIGFFASALS